MKRSDVFLSCASVLPLLAGFFAVYMIVDHHLFAVFHDLGQPIEKAVPYLNSIRAELCLVFILTSFVLMVLQYFITRVLHFDTAASAR